jgi:acyl dehydratase
LGIERPNYENLNRLIAQGMCHISIVLLFKLTHLSRVVHYGIPSIRWIPERRSQ